MKQSNTEWLMTWYAAQCNGDWEHHFGVRMETLDNPGWSIKIDTTGTIRPLADREWVLVEVSEGDWYGYKNEGGVFDAAGDPGKLEYLIGVFREVWERT